MHTLIRSPGVVDTAPDGHAPGEDECYHCGLPLSRSGLLAGLVAWLLVIHLRALLSLGSPWSCFARGAMPVNENGPEVHLVDHFVILVSPSASRRG